MRIAAGVTLVVLLVLAVSGAWADQPEEFVLYGSYEDTPSVGWWPAGANGMIAIGGVELFEIPGNGGGVTLPVRAEIVDARITEILSDGICGPVRVGAVRGQPTIYVAEHRLITVYDEDAANAGARCAETLAKKWARSTAAALLRVIPTSSAPPWFLAEETAPRRRRG